MSRSLNLEIPDKVSVFLKSEADKLGLRVTKYVLFLLIEKFNQTNKEKEEIN